MKKIMLLLVSVFSISTSTIAQSNQINSNVTLSQVGRIQYLTFYGQVANTLWNKMGAVAVRRGTKRGDFITCINNRQNIKMCNVAIIVTDGSGRNGQSGNLAQQRAFVQGQTIAMALGSLSVNRIDRNRGDMTITGEAALLLYSALDPRRLDNTMGTQQRFGDQFVCGKINPRRRLSDENAQCEFNIDNFATGSMGVPAHG